MEKFIAGMKCQKLEIVQVKGDRRREALNKQLNLANKDASSIFLGKSRLQSKNRQHAKTRFNASNRNIS
jgi:hypothetical protein